MIQIFPAVPADIAEIDRLADQAFGPARRNRTAYQLRDNVTPIPELSFVARDVEALVGSVQCWPLQLRSLAGGIQPLTLLGPLITAAAWRGQGIASRLITATLGAADARGDPPILLIGDEPFYRRFGFSAAATGGWHLPGPVDRARLLLRAGNNATALPVNGWITAPDGARRAA